MSGEITRVETPKGLTVEWLPDGTVGPAWFSKSVTFVQDGLVVGIGPDVRTEVTADGSRGLSMQAIVALIMATQAGAQ